MASLVRRQCSGRRWRPSLRQSLRNTVRRVPPKWGAEPEAERWVVVPPARSPTVRLSPRGTLGTRLPPTGEGAPWICLARRCWTCRYLCRTCRICWTCWLSWTEPRVAARGAVTLTELAARGAVTLTELPSRSSPCYLRGGRVGWAPPAGRGEWRCGRRRRREAGPGAGTARRT
eukprot:scaffold45241_cov48-Phaeocystis_antarctica.AAC.2